MVHSSGSGDVQVRMGDKFSMTKLEMQRAGVNTAYDARIPPKSVNLFWRAAELVGARLSRRKVKYSVIQMFSGLVQGKVYSLAVQNKILHLFRFCRSDAKSRGTCSFTFLPKPRARRRQTCAKLDTSLSRFLVLISHSSFRIFLEVP